MKPVKDNQLPQPHRPNKPTNESADSPASDLAPDPDAFKRLLAQYKAKVYEKYASTF